MAKGKDEAYNPKRRPPRYDFGVDSDSELVEESERRAEQPDWVLHKSGELDREEMQAREDAKGNDGVAGPGDAKDNSGFSDNEIKD